jgi:hypothetical protein
LVGSVVGRKKNISRVDIGDYLPKEEPKGLTPEIVAEVPRPRRPAGQIIAVSRQPHVDVIRDDLYKTLLEESRRLRDKSRSEQLDEFEFSRMVRAAEALTRLSKDQREQDKADNVEELSDEELQEAILLASERRKMLKP